MQTPMFTPEQMALLARLQGRSPAQVKTGPFDPADGFGYANPPTIHHTFVGERPPDPAFLQMLRNRPSPGGDDGGFSTYPPMPAGRRPELTQPNTPTPPDPAAVAQAAQRMMGPRPFVGPPAPVAQAQAQAPAAAPMPTPARNPSAAEALAQIGPQADSLPTDQVEKLQGPFYKIEKKLEEKSSHLGRSTDLLPEAVHLGAKERAMQLASFEQQRQGLSDEMAMLKKIAQTPDGLDLSPVAALVDQWTGSNFSKTYKKPDARARQIEDFGLNDKMLQRQQQLSSDQLGLYKAQLSGYQQDQLMKTMLTANQVSNKPAGGNGRGEAQQAKFASDYRNAIGKMDADLTETKAQYRIIDDALNSGSYAHINITLGQLARRISSEKGVLRDSDIERTMPRSFNGDTYKFLTYVSSLTPDTPVPPEYTDSLKAIVNFAKKKDAEKFQSQLDSAEQRFRPDQHWQEENQGVVTTAAAKRVKEFMPETKAEPTIDDMWKKIKAERNGGASTPVAPVAPAAPVATPAEPSIMDLWNKIKAERAGKKDGK